MEDRSRDCWRCQSPICDEDYGACIDGPYDRKGTPLNTRLYYLSLKADNGKRSERKMIGRFRNPDEAARYVLENQMLCSLGKDSIIIELWTKKRIIGYDKVYNRMFVKTLGKWEPWM